MILERRTERNQGNPRILVWATSRIHWDLKQINKHKATVAETMNTLGSAVQFHRMLSLRPPCRNSLFFFRTTAGTIYIISFILIIFQVGNKFEDLMVNTLMCNSVDIETVKLILQTFFLSSTLCCLFRVFMCKNKEF